MKSFLTLLTTLLFSQFALSQTFNGNENDIKSILENTTKFSGYVMASEYEGIAASYTKDAKIFPNRSLILEGEDIKSYWVQPDGYSTKHHKITQSEVSIIGDTAYDYGYYEGISTNPKGEESEWAGKYVIVWKKEDGDWKMFLDIWNSAPLDFPKK